MIVQTDATPATQRRRWPGYRSFLVAFVAILPVAFSLLLLRWWLDASLFDYVPVLSDEVSYWHQANSFARVGFAHGYYTYQEVPPLVGAAGPWGPAVSALTGSIMLVTGLTGKLAALPVIMIGAFVALTAAGLAMARRSAAGLLGAGVLLVTFGPLILYLGTGMQEPLHLGLGVLLAALFHRQIEEPDPRLAVLTVAMIVAGSLLRPLWAVLLLPALLLHWHDTTRQRILAVAASVGSAGLLFAVFGAWSARFEGPFGYAVFGTPLKDMGGVLRANLERNIEWLFKVDEGVIYKTLIWQHYAVLLIAAGLTIVIVRNRLKNEDRVVALVAWIAIVPWFGMVMIAYDINPGARVLAPGLLFIAMLAVFRGGRWAAVPILIVVINIATWSGFQRDFELIIAHNYSEGEGSISQMRRTLAPHLQYDWGADPWCNTVLLSTQYGFFFEMSAIDPGIGVSLDLSHQFAADRIRSKYVIATEYALFLPSESLVKIVETPPRGALYLNLDSDCPDS